MAKTPSSAIGVDVGRHAMKAVLLQRRGAHRVVLTHFATRELMEELKTVDAFASNLKALLQTLGGTARAYGLSVSNAASLIRIIEQPVMPPEMLRDALRLNSSALLNQDCKDFVLDCDLVPLATPVAQGEATSSTISASPANFAAAAEASSQSGHYVVGGMPRETVNFISEACQKAKFPLSQLQLAPVAVFNAFEFSHDEFKNHAFVLVDIGHLSTTIVVGVKGELILIRTMEYGASHFVEELICHGAASFEEIVELLHAEEVLTVENARLSLTEMVRSISSSIGYFEARREESIPRVYVSGGLAKSSMVLKILTEELQLPCDAWDPFAKCEIQVSPAIRADLAAQLPALSAAYGVAAEILTPR